MSSARGKMACSQSKGTRCQGVAAQGIVGDKLDRGVSTDMDKTGEAYDLISTGGAVCLEVIGQEDRAWDS